ncbi:MAG: hypothetical protein AAB865_02080 [Patescibacteria group bacterium]
MSSLDTVATKIITEQEQVVGPLAWDVAKRIQGLSFTDHEATIKGSAKQVLEQLVKAYEGLFGSASREVCRDAISAMRPQLDEASLPEVLK